MVKVPKQGDILLLDTAPRFGHKQVGRRPYLFLSHDLIAQTSNVVIVAPITTTRRSYPLYLDLSSLGTDELQTRGKIILDQLTTIDYEVCETQYLESLPRGALRMVLAKARIIFQLV